MCERDDVAKWHSQEEHPTHRPFAGILWVTAKRAELKRCNSREGGGRKREASSRGAQVRRMPIPFCHPSITNAASSTVVMEW